MRERPKGLSARWKLTISYAAFLTLAGTVFFALCIAVLRFVPDESIVREYGGGFVPRRSDLIDYGLPLAGLGIAFLACVGLVGGWFLAGRLLRPLRVLEAGIDRVQHASLVHRIDMAGPDDEFRRIADSFDDMLGRLERSFAEQQRFAANASHELRTPLAITKAMLEFARTDPDLDTARTAELLRRLDVTNERSIALVESLLRLSRVSATPISMAPVRLDALVQETVAAHAPDFRARGWRIESALPPAAVAGDADLLRQLVENLVGNALRHGGPGPRGSAAAQPGEAQPGEARFPSGASSPGAPSLAITMASEQGRIVLHVENSGRPLEPALVHRLAEPFVRGARSARTAGAGDAAPDGTGLGLALVRSIAEAHGGTLSLRHGADGGLAVEVRLPAAR